MKYNDETNFEPRFLAECRRRLDELLDAEHPEMRCSICSWFYGALTAIRAITGEVWALEKLNRIYYLESEDGTQRVTPNVLDRFI